MTDTAGNNILEVISKADRFNSWMYHAIKPNVSGKVLEVGSGIGNISKHFVSDNYIITLSDTDDFYIDILKKKFGSLKNEVQVISLDILHPEFEMAYHEYKEDFNSVVLLNVLEHIKDDRQAIENCAFLLKPGGILTILTPAYKFLFSKIDKELGHYRRYTAGSLKKIIASTSLEPDKINYFNSIGIAGWLYGKITRLKTIPGNEMNLFNRLVPIGKIIDKLVFQKAGLSVIATARKPLK